MRNKEDNTSQKNVTVWFGKEVDIDTVRLTVKKLNALGYIVVPTFYIGYNIDNSIVSRYLKNSLDCSDYLYILGEEGSLLKEITSYAITTEKPIIGKESFNLCCLG